MLKKRLEYSRTAALVVILAMSGSGVKALVSSFAATANYGSVRLTTYVYGDGGALDRIGNVTVGIESVGVGAEGCTANSGTTNAAQGDGYGQITLDHCRVANNPTNFGGTTVYWKRFRLIQADRPNYEFRSARIVTSNGPVELLPPTNDPNGVKNEFVVDKDKTTSIQVWMNDKTPPPPAPEPTPTSTPAPTPAPAPAPPNPADKNGALEVTSYIYYSNSQLQRQANVGISLESTNRDNNNAGYRCDQTSKTTDPSGGSQSANQNYAQANFTNCWTSSDGSKQYKLNGINVPNGYTFRSIHIIGDDKFDNAQTGSENAQETFQIKKDHKTRIAVWMNPPPGEAPPAPTQPQPDPTPTNKNGDIQVTTYVFESDKITRQGNVTVSVKSMNADNSQATFTCDQTTKTTNSGGGSEAANPNYAQATFSNCWTTSAGSHKYQLSRVELPAGYAFSSFRTQGDSKFIDGSDNTQDIGQQFEVKKDQTTKLAIWMKKVAPPTVPASGTSGGGGTTGSAGSSSGGSQGGSPTTSAPTGGAVHQVVTAGGVAYVAANNKPASQALATLLNAAISAGQLDPNAKISSGGSGPSDPKVECDDFCDDPGGDDPELEEEESGDEFTPPTAPTNLTASQDASGSIQLNWTASAGNPAEESVYYTVERSEPNTTDTVDADTQDTQLVDSEDLKYPVEYTYKVYASDDEGNNSDSASVTITTQPLAPNITAEAAAAHAQTTTTGGEEDPTVDPTGEGSEIEGPAVTIEGTEEAGGMQATIPVGASQTPMACAVSDGDNEDSEMLLAIGDAPSGSSQLVCRQPDGKEVEDFDQEAEMSFDLDSNEDLADSEVYAFDGTDWNEVPMQGDDTEVSNSSGATAKRVKSGAKVKAAHIVVKSKKPLKLAVVKNRKNQAASYLLLLPAVGLAGGAVVIYFVRRRKLGLAMIPDVRHLDLMPTKKDPTRDYVQPLNQVQAQQPPPTVIQPSQTVRPEGWDRKDENEIR